MFLCKLICNRKSCTLSINANFHCGKSSSDSQDSYLPKVPKLKEIIK